MVDTNAGEEIKQVIEEHKIQRDGEKKQDLIQAKNMLDVMGIELSEEEKKDIEVKKEKVRKGVAGGISKLFGKVKIGAKKVKEQVGKVSEKLAIQRVHYQR